MSKILSVNINKRNRFLEITVAEHQVYSYPVVWMRDNCRCEKCLFQNTDSRKTEVDSLDVDIDIQTIDIIDEGQGLKIDWPDGHQCDYKLDWFLERQFTKDGQKKREDFFKLPKELWGKEKINSLHAADFQEFITDDDVMFESIVQLEKDGLIMLKNSPAEGAFTQFAQRFESQLRPADHGHSLKERTIFSMRADYIEKQLHEHNVKAYFKERLNFHTDMCFYGSPAEILFLQGVQIDHVEGGESIFTDGFKAAKDLKENYPDYHRILSTYPVYHKDYGNYYYDFQYHGNSPCIRLDMNGETESIRYSNYQRRSEFNIPLENVESFYRAYKTFADIMDRNRITMALQPGDLAVIDNTRVLHGRMPFNILKPEGIRLLKGSYMDWDDIRSKRRVLQLKRCSNK